MSQNENIASNLSSGKARGHFATSNKPESCNRVDSGFFALTSTEKKLIEAGAGYQDENGRFRHYKEGMVYEITASGYKPSDSVSTDMIKWALVDRRPAMVFVYLAARSVASFLGGKVSKDHLIQEVSKRTGLSERTTKKYLMVCHSHGWVKITRGKFWVQGHDKVCYLMGFDETVRVDLVNNNQDITRGSIALFKSFCYSVDTSRSLWGKSLYRQYSANPHAGTEARISTKLQETGTDRNGTRTKVTGERAIRLSVDDLGYSLGTIYKYKKGAISNGMIKVRKQFCPEVDRYNLKTKESLWTYIKYVNEGHLNFEFDKRIGIYRKRDCDIITSLINVKKRRLKSECSSTLKDYSGTPPAGASLS